MKPNISRHIDERLLSGQAKSIRQIAMLLNGFHCKIYYLASGEYSLDGYLSAALNGTVSIWHHQANDAAGIRISDVVAFEDALKPVLSRFIAGTGHIWTGKTHVASWTDDAGGARDEIAAVFARVSRSHVSRIEAARDTVPAPYVELDADWMARTFRQEQKGNDCHAIGMRSGHGRPIVSVIVAVHNKAQFISECLNSVSSQRTDDLEIICVDDASTDDSLEAIAATMAADARIKLIRNENNCGAGQTRNIGLAAATGAYVMFLDADDMLAPNALQLLLTEAATTGSDLVRGGIMFYFAGSVPSLRAADTPPSRRGYRVADEPHLWIPWWFTTYLYRRSFLISQAIDFPDLKDGEDPVFLARALTAAESISSICDTVYYYRKHGGQKRSDMEFLAHLITVKDLFDRHEPRMWKDGYGMYVMMHDLSARLLRASSPEKREELRKAILSLGVFPEHTLHRLLEDIA